MSGGRFNYMGELKKSGTRGVRIMGKDEILGKLMQKIDSVGKDPNPGWVTVDVEFLKEIAEFMKHRCEDPKIEFVSYNGKWPNLCSGELTLRVNGEVRLMPELLLISGGKCGFKDKDFSEPYVEKGEWRIVDSKLPEDLKPYRKEIVRIINENVPHGCCGGCL